MTVGIEALEAFVVARGAFKERLDAMVAEQFSDPTTLPGAAPGPPAFDDDRFLFAFSSAARLLGKSPVVATPAEVADLAKGGVHWPLEGLGTDELGRMLLVGRACARLPADRAAAMVEGCYARGDNRERQAVLRALPLLPERARFVSLAVDACRTSVQTVFEAIACENPFPADEFSDLAINQMVLKAMFNGVALRRIVGLDRRKGPELARMAADYAAERRAAGRTVPSDIDLVLRPSSSPGGTT